MTNDLRSMLKNISNRPIQNSNTFISLPTENPYRPIEITPKFRCTWHDINNQYSNWNVDLKNTTIFTINNFKIEVDSLVINHYHIELDQDRSSDNQRTILSLPEWKKSNGAFKSNEIYHFNVTVLGNNPYFNLLYID